MKVYTKRGDKGTTGLLYGGRVRKDDLRTHAYGATDEAVSVLGVARSFLEPQSKWSSIILRIQRELFVVGAQLATDKSNIHKLNDGVTKVTSNMVDDLETLIDSLTEMYPLPQAFIVPGQSQPGAFIDHARAIVRRSERNIVTMQQEDLLGEPGEIVLQYINRLSDLLFVLARSIEAGNVVYANKEDE